MTTINDIPGDTPAEQRDWLFRRWYGVSEMLDKAIAQRDELRKAATALAEYIHEVDEARGVVYLRLNIAVELGVVRSQQPNLYAALVTLYRARVKTVAAE